MALRRSTWYRHWSVVVMSNTMKPRVFWLHFNRLNVRRGDPDVWTVHRSDRCMQVKKIVVQVPVETVYKGAQAPQPRAFFRGKGVVRIANGIAYITQT